MFLLLLLTTTGAVLADSGGWPTYTPTATPTPSLTPTWTPIPIPTITLVPGQSGEIPPGPGAPFFTPQASPKALPTGTLLSGDQILATLQAGSPGQPQPPVANRNSAALIVFILVAAGLLVLGLAVYLWWYWSNRQAQPPTDTSNTG
jgi:hypothetical protein